ncbi:MAG: OadG family protein, partial [Desulfofustis sp.]|nr:OadG family protein [Desulfofustis sp.]
MDMIERLALFADPATIGQLSFADKMLAGLATTLLGMGVTFLSLIVLHGVIVLLGRISAPSSAPSATVPAEQVA